MKKIIFIINIFMIILIIYHSYLYQTTGFKMHLKITCSSLAVILGIINFIYNKQIKNKYNISICIGLLLSVLGDYFILYDFVKGALFFALGHIAFLISHHTVNKSKKLDFILTIISFLGCLIFLLTCPHETLEYLSFKIVAIVYSIIISFMFGKAISNFLYKKNKLTFIVLIASLLFFFSDIMLVTSFFYNNLTWADNVCLTTYFSSLPLFAFSMLFINKN